MKYKFLCSSLIVCALMLGTSAKASLFEDGDARKAILELREKVEAQRQSIEQLRSSTEALADDNVKLKQSILSLQGTIEELKQQIASMGGDREVLGKSLSDLQRKFMDQSKNYEDRFANLEPQKVSVDGIEFSADQAEKRDYEAALALFKKADYSAASQAFGDFSRKYPGSGFGAVALYWLGTSQYATKDFKGAIQSFKSMSNLAPTHPRVPDSMLSMASCMIELKDVKGAKKVLEDLSKNYPQSDAAQAAKDRLSKLK